jgi:putative membrane protein
MMLSDADRTRIAQAISANEAKTSGEIYCVMMKSSSDYRLVPIAWASIIALIVPLPFIYFTAWPAAVIYLLQLIAFVGAAIGLSQRSVRFKIVPRRAKHDRAHAEAMRQFWAQGLHNTASRTGVLIFVSAAERYAEIVADAVINEKVSPEVWKQAMQALITGIKQDKLADGFVAAIEQCGAVLAQHFPPGTSNPDELPNKLVEM